MDATEHIQTHILSVWMEEKKFLKRGVEGMLFLTEKHVMFVTKTEKKLNWYDPLMMRQIKNLQKSPSTMIRHDDYVDDDLRRDIQNEKNMEIPFSLILNVDSEEKSWGSVLKLEINMGDKSKKYEFSIVSGWVKYPAKDPIKYMRVDWKPFVDYIKHRIT